MGDLKSVQNLSESNANGPMMSKRYIPKQFDFDALMDLDKDQREVVLSLINSNGSFRDEVRVMLDSMGLIIDQREGKINQVLKG